MSPFQHTSTLSTRAGFTMVELIVVTAILGVLALMAIPAFNDYKTKAQNKRSASDIRTIEKAITAHILDRNSLPASLADIGMATQMDPWGRPYQYNKGGILDDGLNKLNDDYDLYSTGKDGASDPDGSKPESADDIVRMNDGGYAGERS
jgi:general secretion pathway protein G